MKALCPAQAIDRFTPPAWYSVLEKYGFEDASGAVRRLADTHRFIAVADIIGELARVHNLELERQRSAELMSEIKDRDTEVREGRRGRPPAELAETLAELKRRLAKDDAATR